MQITETAVRLRARHPVVDVEISNDPRDPSGGLDWNRGEISVAGFLVGNKVTQFLLKNPSRRADLRQAMLSFLPTLQGHRLHALHVDVERGCFQNLLGFSPELHEVRPPVRGKGTSKEYFYGYLVRKGRATPTTIGVEDPLGGQSQLCQARWREGRYEDVRLHNICCLLKEATILEHRDFLASAFAGLTDQNGWLKPGAILP